MLRLYVTMTILVEILVTKSFGTNITLTQSQLYHTLRRKLLAKNSKVTCGLTLATQSEENM